MGRLTFAVFVNFPITHPFTSSYSTLATKTMVLSLRERLNQQYARNSLQDDTLLSKAVRLLEHKINWEKAEKITCIKDLCPLLPSNLLHGVPEPTVAGQTIMDVFGDDEMNILRQAMGDGIVTFSNGGEINITQPVKKVVESKKRKIMNESNNPYRPSDGMIAVGLLLFTKKRKKSFFRDSIYACTVFADELQTSLVWFLKLRGWKAVVEDGNVRVSYVRITECLKMIGEEKARAYYHASSMMESLYHVLQSNDLFPVPSNNFWDYDSLMGVVPGAATTSTKANTNFVEGPGVAVSNETGDVVGNNNSQGQNGCSLPVPVPASAVLSVKEGTRRHAGDPNSDTDDCQTTSDEDEDDISVYEEETIDSEDEEGEECLDGLEALGVELSIETPRTKKARKTKDRAHSKKDHNVIKFFLKLSSWQN